MNAIVDADAAARAGRGVVDLARAFLDGGARFLQLRAKAWPSGALLDAATEIVALAHAVGAIVIVNDRPDIARLSGADGVHVGQEDLAPAAARAIVGDDAIVGLSTHTDEQIARADGEPVTYIAVGPIFGTATKATGYEAVGLDLVRRAAQRGRPVVAIGGITHENAASVIAAGASSVAVVGALVGDGDPASRVREMLTRLGPPP